MKKIISLTLALVLIIGTLCVFPASAAVKKPKTLKAANTSEGIKLSWSKVSGAKYKVYRGKTLIKKSVKGTSCIDRAAKAGKTYTYKVKAFKGKNLSKAASVKATRMNAPYIQNTRFRTTGVKVAINGVKGADKYVLYKKTEGESSFVKVGSTKGGSIMDTKVVSNKRITYKVRAYSSKTKMYSAYSNETTTHSAFLNTPQLKSTVVFSEDGQPAIEWEPVADAENYKIYRSVLIGGYGLVDKVETTSFTDSEKFINPLVVRYMVFADNSNGGFSGNSHNCTAYIIPEGSFTTDGDQNLNINLKLAADEKYKAGEMLIRHLSTEKPDNPDEAISYDIETVSGEDVISVENGVITGLKAGEAQIKVTLSKGAAKKLDSYIDTLRGLTSEEKFSNHLETGVVLVNVTVE